MKIIQPYKFLSLLCCYVVLIYLGGCARLDKQVPIIEPLKPEGSKIIKAIPTPVKPKPIVATELIVIGEAEPVTLIAVKETFPARIDTGAITSSIDAREIVRFERDGESWVRFYVKDRQTGTLHKLESKLTRIVAVKRHGIDTQSRIVVKLEVKIGSKTLRREFSLTDRSSFEYPVLVGRNILEGYFVVDVSKKNTRSLMKENTPDEN